MNQLPCESDVEREETAGPRWSRRLPASERPPPALKEDRHASSVAFESECDLHKKLKLSLSGNTRIWGSLSNMRTCLCPATPFLNGACGYSVCRPGKSRREAKKAGLPVLPIASETLKHLSACRQPMP